MQKTVLQVAGGILCWIMSFVAQAQTCDQYNAQTLNSKAAIYQQEIQTAAKKYHLSPNLIKAVMTAESCFRPESVSPKGAGGLMQLMPATARRFGVSDRFNVAQNIDGGARYLRFLLNRYRGSIHHAVAAYNAGEGAVDKHGTSVPYQETRVYVVKVMNALSKLNGGAGGYNSMPVAQPQFAVYTTSAPQRVQPAAETAFLQDSAERRKPLFNPVHTGVLEQGSFIQTYRR